MDRRRHFGGAAERETAHIATSNCFTDHGMRRVVASIDHEFCGVPVRFWPDLTFLQTSTPEPERNPARAPPETHDAHDSALRAADWRRILITTTRGNDKCATN